MGKKIKQFRKMRGWSLNDLAEKVSINLKILDLYEKGQAQISFDLLADLAKKLETSPHVFLVEEDAYPVQVPELKVFQANSAKNAPKLREEDYVSIPLTESSIAAGQPIEALRDNSETMGIPASLLGSGEHYALEVSGDSMIDAGIHDGDIAVVQRCDTAENGTIVVALIDNNEVTLKRLRRKGASIALEPANAAHETRIFGPDRVSVQGRLVALIRKY